MNVEDTIQLQIPHQRRRGQEERLPAVVMLSKIIQNVDLNIMFEFLSDPMNALDPPPDFIIQSIECLFKVNFYLSQAVVTFYVASSIIKREC